MIGVLSIGIVFVCRLLLVHICKVGHGSAGAKIMFNVLRYSAEITPVVCSLYELFKKKIHAPHGRRAGNTCRKGRGVGVKGALEIWAGPREGVWT